MESGEVENGKTRGIKLPDQVPQFRQQSLLTTAGKQNELDEYGQRLERTSLNWTLCSPSISVASPSFHPSFHHRFTINHWYRLLKESLHWT